MAEDTPTRQIPRIDGKGVRVPWAWIVALAPSCGLLGAFGHMSLFGAPPEFSDRLNEHQKVITELHEHDALKEQRLESISDTLKRIEAEIQAINSKIK